MSVNLSPADLIIINNIKAKYNELTILRVEDSSSKVERIVDAILEDLSALSTVDLGFESKRAFAQLAHSKGKELRHVAYAYDKMNKTNAAKVRTKEYAESLVMIAGRVRQDIWNILNYSEYL
jgi:fumarate hydratase class II